MDRLTLLPPSTENDNRDPMASLDDLRDDLRNELRELYKDPDNVDRKHLLNRGLALASCLLACPNDDEAKKVYATPDPHFLARIVDVNDGAEGYNELYDNLCEITDRGVRIGKFGVGVFNAVHSSHAKEGALAHACIVESLLLPKEEVGEW